MEYPSLKNYDTSGNLPLLDEGEYTVRLDSVSDANKDGKKHQFKDGTDYCLFDFAVHGHKNKLFEKIVLDEKYQHSGMQLGKLKAMLIAMGVDPDQSGNVRDLVGKTCKVRVVNNGVGGKIYNNIDEYMTLDVPVDFGDTKAEPTKDEDDDLPF